MTGSLEEILAAKERTGILEASELAALKHLRELAEETGTHAASGRTCMLAFDFDWVLTQ